MGAYMPRVAPRLVLLYLLSAAAGCKEERSVHVRSLKFEGVKAIDEGRLRLALATHAGAKLPWGKKAFFDRASFDTDIKRIQAFYADRGYPHARITGVNITPNDKQRSVDLTVRIDEGDPLRIARLDFVGLDVVPIDQAEAFKEQVSLAIGEPLDRQRVIATREQAINLLRDHGYPYAVVNVREDAAADGGAASLTFTAEPGALARIGQIQVQGNLSVSARVIERSLIFKPGDLYRRRTLQEAQRRLYALELFRFANIEPITQQLQPAEVPVRVTVAEGKHQRINFGVGYGTEDQARADARYRHVNFLGGARVAGVHARWSSLDRGLQLVFNQPYFIRPSLSLGGDGQLWRTITPAYESEVWGGRMTLRFAKTARTSWALSLTDEYTTSTIAPDVQDDLSLRDDLIALGLDPTTGSQSGALHAFGFDLLHSTTNSIPDATRGYQIAFHGEEAGHIVAGDFNYYATLIEGRHYVPLLADRLILASRLQMGNIRPAGDLPENIPFAKKYFLGGATSIRGWGRYEVSPLSESGLPIGGNSMVAFSEELRARIFGHLGAVLFLDGGNVWADSWSIDFGDLRYAVGPGLRYLTPMGALRFDIGYQLNDIPGLVLENGEPQHRAWRMHFSIGHAF
jgi:outer membrane protein assembly complex protein YaeT